MATTRGEIRDIFNQMNVSKTILKEAIPDISSPKDTTPVDPGPVSTDMGFEGVIQNEIRAYVGKNNKGDQVIKLEFSRVGSPKVYSQIIPMEWSGILADKLAKIYYDWKMAQRLG